MIAKRSRNVLKIIPQTSRQILYKSFHADVVAQKLIGDYMYYVDIYIIILYI